MFKLMDKKIIAILRKLFLRNWPYAVQYIYAFICFRYEYPELDGAFTYIFATNGQSFDPIQYSYAFIFSDMHIQS